MHRLLEVGVGEVGVEVAAWLYRLRFPRSAQE